MNQTTDSAIASRAMAAVLLISALYVMAADYFNVRQAQAMQSVAEPDELDWPQPWGGYAWRHLVRDAGNNWRLDATSAERLIHQAAKRYPLDSVQWLDLARIGIAVNRPAEQINTWLQTAHSVEPGRRETLWSATQIALQADQTYLAEQYLGEWLKTRPTDTERALFIAARWLDTPEQQIDRLLPSEGRDHLEQAMAIARRRHDRTLADVVWTRLQPKPNINDRVFLDYIELLLDTGESHRASQLWRERRPEVSNGLFNGGFDHALGESLGLNWRLDKRPDSVHIERDSQHFHLGPASLAIHFNGQENVHLNAPWIRIPVEPGRNYQLTGYWSAEGLTTQNLPYLFLSAEGARLEQKTEVPAHSFDWQSWSLEFTAPEQSRVVQFGLKRDPSNAFDRNIAGRLWLDQISLRPAQLSNTISATSNG